MKKFFQWCDNHKWTYVIAILCFIVVPVLVEYSSVLYGQHKIQGDWLNFWGSYLGIIPSGLIAYFVAKFQIADTKESDYMNHIQQLYLTDLRDIKNQLLIYPLTEYKDLKYYKEKTTYTKTDVNLFQKPFILEKEGFNGVKLSNDVLNNITRIVQGLPSEKREKFQYFINCLNEESKKLLRFSPSDFDNLYSAIQEAEFNGVEMGDERLDKPRKELIEKSALLWSRWNNVMKTFKQFEETLNAELAVYYNL